MKSKKRDNNEIQFKTSSSAFTFNLNIFKSIGQLYLVVNENQGNENSGSKSMSSFVSHQLHETRKSDVIVPYSQDTYKYNERQARFLNCWEIEKDEGHFVAFISLDALSIAALISFYSLG